MDVNVNIPDERLKDEFINGIEYGIAYWAEVREYRPDDVKATIYDFEESKVYFLALDDLKRGLQVMAEKYPKHFSDILNENSDSITADALIQCSVFGDIIYG